MRFTRRRRRASEGITVGVPPVLAGLAPGTGHTNVFRHVLDLLQGDLDVLVAHTTNRRRPDVWLYDGHQVALEVAEPVVVHVHEAGWDTPELAACFEPGFLAVLERQTAHSVRAAALVITPSTSSRDQVIERWQLEPARVHMVPFGVDHAVFHPGRTGGPELVARAGGQADVPYVLFVSGLHPRKNFEAVRDAVDRLRVAGYPHQLVLVGRPAPDRLDPEAEIAAAVAPLERSGAPVVRVVEPTDDEMASLMAGAAAFALPSLMEGFGLTALEAMACGTPVVVSDRGSLPEVVGDTGLVVTPDGEAVAGALARLLDDPEAARAIGEAGRVRSLDYPWSRTAAGWAHALTTAAKAS